MSYDPTDLDGQERQAEESAEQARTRQLQEDADFRWLMRQRPFRRFMWKLMGDVGLFRTTFNREHAVVSFLEGQRNVGLQQLARIEALIPEGFDLMRSEVRVTQEKKPDASA